MLVLTRTRGENVIIANNIKIEVIHIGDGKVKLGIDAPAYIEVNRGEIQEAKDRERAAGVEPTPDDFERMGKLARRVRRSGGMP